MNDDSLMELVKAYKSMTLDERLLVIPKIIEEIGPSLRLYAFTLTSDSSAALDIYQETLISIFSSLNTFKGDTRGQLFSWCRRIARNRAADEYRENNLIKFDPLPLDEFQEFIKSETPSDPLTAERNLDLDYALNLLAESKPECRELLWKHYVVGVDYAELAEEAGLQYDAIRMRINRCLDSAREGLE